MTSRRTVIGRAMALAAGYVMVVAGLAWASAGLGPQLRHQRLASFDALLAVTAAAGAWVCVGWLTVGFAVTALAAVPGAVGQWCAEASARMAPAAVRRLACAVIGGVLVSGAGGLPEAVAYSPEVPVTTPAALPDLERPAVPATEPAALPDLDRPAGGRQPGGEQRTQPGAACPPATTGAASATIAAAGPATAKAGLPDAAGAGSPAERAGRQVVVRPGDTLWGIAADHLDPAASAAEVATAWPRWYEANRRLIGGDPDLILPGQRLRAPAHPTSEPKGSKEELR